MLIKYILGAALLIFVAAAILYSQGFVGGVDEPKFTVISKQGSTEIRSYPILLIAEVQVQGERDKAINEGFKKLAAFIFGDNKEKIKVSMTAPVMQQDMGSGAVWKISFVMPASFSKSTLPTPVDPDVMIRELPESRFVALRFSGSWDEEKIKGHLAELKNQITTQHLKTKGEPLFAFYNPPWTLPFLRRNEVMFELDQAE